MLEPKYIVYHDELHEIDDVVIFSGYQKHCEVAHRLHGPVISAGFVEMWASIYGVVEITCSGESDSLKVQSRPEEDAALIAERLQLVQ